MNERRLGTRLLKLIAVFAALGAAALAAKNADGLYEGLSGAASLAAENITVKTAPIPLYGSGEAMLFYRNESVSAAIIKRGAAAGDRYFLPVNAAETEEVPESTVRLLTRNISTVREDLSAFSDADGEIYAAFIGANEGESYLNLPSGAQIRNCTELSAEEILSLTAEKPDLTLLGGAEPEVLIIHTHTSESYQPSDDVFDLDYTSRSLDPTQSVVAVGSKIAEQIAEAGISVIHDGTVHDSPYSGAYDRSAETMRKIIAEYPSIKIILDIHRDAIEEPDGSRTAVVTEIGGKKAAQVMIIAAADDGTYNIPKFRENLSFAALLQEQMESDNRGLTRPVLFQYCHYNQDISTGSLLIEVGSHGNTLAEALYSGELAGKSIARALLSLKNT